MQTMQCPGPWVEHAVQTEQLLDVVTERAAELTMARETAFQTAGVSAVIQLQKGSQRNPQNESSNHPSACFGYGANLCSCIANATTEFVLLFRTAVRNISLLYMIMHDL